MTSDDGGEESGEDGATAGVSSRRLWRAVIGVAVREDQGGVSCGPM